MSLYDPILPLPRHRTPKTDKTSQTHRMLGLDSSLRPDVSLVDFRSSDHQNKSERLDLNENHSDEQLEGHKERPIDHTKQNFHRPERISETRTEEKRGGFGCGRSNSSWWAAETKTKHPTSVPDGLTQIESPGIEPWLTSYNFNVKLVNVSFKGCSQPGPTVRSNCYNCSFENVNFIGCKFGHTTLLDVKLVNVTFYHVDFSDAMLYRLILDNVTVFKLQLTGDAWKANLFQNALLGEDNLVSSGGIQSHGFQVASGSTRIKQGYVAAPLAQVDLKRNFCTYGPRKRVIHPLRPAPTGDILSRLAKHKDIIDRIMQYCFPGSSTHIFEYPAGVPIPPRISTELYLAESKWISKHKTTYFGSLHSKTPSQKLRVHVEVPRRGIGNCTGLLLVNKTFHALALKRTYSRCFHFQCSAEGAREFLLAHRENMKLAKQVVLYYHWCQEQLVVRSEIDSWRYLLATIRHQSSFIPSIRLHMGKGFWRHKDIAWRSGVKCILSDKCLSKNPLVDACKFAAPEDRSRFQRGEVVHRTDGTVLQIEIEDTDTQEKRDFVKSLAEEIEKRRVGRPLFVRSPKGYEVTYKCAEQFLKG